ncbi:DUF3103 family protein [Streptacidiphilus griseoplanus]|uniref:DUF3103 family protein n=1 Tax=Peterkaempfera griseoplana TaxID=66896 RepID=UPI0006E3E7EC|nr:DUF3103 family protein [Peterkaempfera griseoplana]
MSKRPLRPTTLVAAILSAITFTTAGTAAAAAPAHPGAAHVPSAVSRIEDQTARAVAAALTDPALRARIRSAALSSHEVDLQALTGRVTTAAGRALHSRLGGADRSIAAAKGLDSKVGSLLRLRLGADSMRTALTADAEPLVASASAGDDSATLTAYDSRGRTHTLDTHSIPSRPVYVVDIDGSRAVAAGMAVLHRAFAERGLSTPAATALDTAGWWATKVDAVEVYDDQEPWFKGDAEMFSLVTGFGLDGKARVDSVDMPYLNNDNTVYYPNQILVNWSNYKYNLADVVMMEDDGDTNYLSLAQALTTALLTIADQGTYIPLVNAVLNAMPASWWTDDPDYVESWYTLAQGSTGRLNGASGNGWMTVEPYFVQQF